jgi:hypothetical protein
MRVSLPGCLAPDEQKKQAIWREATRYCPDFSWRETPHEIHAWALPFYRRLELVRLAWAEGEKVTHEVFALYEPGAFSPVDEAGDTFARADKTEPLRLQGDSPADTAARLRLYVALRLAFLGSSGDALGRGGPLTVRLLDDEIAAALGIVNAPAFSYEQYESRDVNGDVVFIVSAHLLQQELGQRATARPVQVNVWRDGHLLVLPGEGEEPVRIGADDLQLADTHRGLWAQSVRTIPPPPAFLEWAPAEPELESKFKAAVKDTVALAGLVVRAARLPFYRNFQLVQATLGEARGEVRYALCRPEAQTLDILALAGGSAAVHDANARTNSEGQRELLEERAGSEEYLTFFCWAVDGDEGHFLIASAPGELQLLRPLSEEQEAFFYGDRAQFGVRREVAEGGTRWLARLLYGNALFDSKFTINTEGMIEMVDDEPVIANLPVESQAFGAGGLVKFTYDGPNVTFSSKTSAAMAAPPSTRDTHQTHRRAANLRMSVDDFESMHAPELKAGERAGFRIIRAQTFEEPYVVPPAEGESVIFVGCLFLRGFRLRARTSMGSLHFVGCVFLGDGEARESDIAVDLSECDCSGAISFERSVLQGRLHAPGLRVRRSLRLRGVRIATDPSGLQEPIDREFFGKDVQPGAGAPRAAREESWLPEVLSGRTKFRAVSLAGCRVEADLELCFDTLTNENDLGQVSIVAGDIDLGGCRIDGGLLVAGLWCAGEISLKLGRIGADLVASVRWFGPQLRCTGLDASLAELGGNVDLSCANLRGDVVLAQAKVLGWLDFLASQIRGGLNIAQATVHGSVRLDGVRIRKDTELTFGKFFGRISAIRGRNGEWLPATFSGNLIITGAEGPALDFRGAVVEGQVKARAGHFGTIAFTLGVTRDAESGLCWPVGCALGAVDFAGVEVDGDVDLVGVQVQGKPVWAPYRSTTADNPELRSSVLFRRCQIGGDFTFSEADPCFKLERWVGRDLIDAAARDAETAKQKAGSLVRWGDTQAAESGETLPTQSHVKAVIFGDLDLRGSNIKGQLNVQNTLVENRILLDDAEVAVDVEMHAERRGLWGQTHYDLETSCGAFNLETFECGGSLKLTGLRVVSRSRSAHRRLSFPKDVTNGDFRGRGASIKGAVALSTIRDGGARGNTASGPSARIEGRFDLSASDVERLILDRSSFPKHSDTAANGGNWKVNLERASISRLDVRLLPPPLDLTAVRIQRWEVIREEGQNRDDASEYIQILQAMQPLDRSVWTGIEQSLRNHADNASADRVYIAMRDEIRRRRLQESPKLRWTWSHWRESVHRALFAYGTSPGRAFWAFNALLMPLMFLIALHPANMTASDDQLGALATRCRSETNVSLVCRAYRHATSREGLDVQLSPVDLGSEWTLRDSVAIWLRYELPIIAITTDTDWIPSTDRNTRLTSSVELPVSPRAFAFSAMIGNWVLLPLYVAFLAARLVRRAA